MEHDRIYHRDLGALGYQKGPQSIHRWHGDMEGCEQGFDIILNEPDLDLADAGLIAGVGTGAVSVVKSGRRGSVPAGRAPL